MICYQPADLERGKGGAYVRTNKERRICGRIESDRCR